MIEEAQVVVIGAGAAGIAAGRRLTEAGLDCLLLEARGRVGGRAFTVKASDTVSLDLGCGWLHSADRNPFVPIAERLGHRIDRSRAPWARRFANVDFSDEEQAGFSAAQAALDRRVASIRDAPEDCPVGAFLEPGNRWNPLIDAVSTYYSGAETNLVSALDLDRYDDSGINWRVREGYGRTVEAYANGLPVRLGCTVLGVDHRGPTIVVETSQGPLRASAVVVTIPSRLLAEERIRFTPSLPEKTEAAAGLPLGLADKLYLALDGAEGLEAESRAFGRLDRVATGAYHFRPFGLPLIECYFGGSLASGLERSGAEAFLDFARSELSGLFGSDFARRVHPLPMHLWQSDPLAGGSYSYASPGKAHLRQVLAEPVEGRIYFAGEACSTADFSTAHGALLTGRAAADGAISALRPATLPDRLPQAR